MPGPERKALHQGPGLGHQTEATTVQRSMVRQASLGKVVGSGEQPNYETDWTEASDGTRESEREKYREKDQGGERHSKRGKIRWGRWEGK